MTEPSVGGVVLIQSYLLNEVEAKLKETIPKSLLVSQVHVCMQDQCLHQPHRRIHHYSLVESISMVHTQHSQYHG